MVFSTINYGQLCKNIGGMTNGMAELKGFDFTRLYLKVQYYLQL